MQAETRTRLTVFLNPYHAIEDTGPENHNDPLCVFEFGYGRWQHFLNDHLEEILNEFERHPLARRVSESFTIRNDAGMAERICCHLYGNCYDAMLRIYADCLIDVATPPLVAREKMEAFVSENLARIENLYWAPARRRLELDMSAVSTYCAEMPARVTADVLREFEGAIWRPRNPNWFLPGSAVSDSGDHDPQITWSELGNQQPSQPSSSKRRGLVIRDLRARREALGLTQAELAGLCDGKAKDGAIAIRTYQRVEDRGSGDSRVVEAIEYELLKLEARKKGDR